ncbi:methyltransferase domain-containing protein [Shewanella algae]|uniref:methyltransferase domain-containing protein n=1 Tax=Shewanella algae TaxID=38313 RepID=UPI00163F453B|nr:methyltransferase domain-containing protein [Shewanella algae]
MSNMSHEPLASHSGLVQSVPLGDVAGRFSKAATAYERHNRVQRLTAEALLDWDDCPHSGKLLDIGAGPGTAFATLWPRSVTALDIASGMLKQLKGNFPDYQVVCGNAEQLPFGDDSFDAVYSNLALQWCGDIPAALAEIFRVMRPGGSARLAIVARGSLPELQTLGLRVKAFAAEHKLEQALAQHPWQSLHTQSRTFQCHFANLRELLYSIKGVGASVGADKNSGAGLKGKGFWHTLNGQAEVLRTDKGMPLTYRIVMVQARK